MVSPRNGLSILLGDWFETAKYSFFLQFSQWCVRAINNQEQFSTVSEEALSKFLKDEWVHDATSLTLVLSVLGGWNLAQKTDIIWQTNWDRLLLFTPVGRMMTSANVATFGIELLKGWPVVYQNQLNIYSWARDYTYDINCILTSQLRESNGLNAYQHQKTPRNHSNNTQVDVRH